jgi:hypothetical protein
LKNGLIFAEVVFEGSGGICMSNKLKFKLEKVTSTGRENLGTRKITVLDAPVFYTTNNPIATNSSAVGTRIYRYDESNTSSPLSNNAPIPTTTPAIATLELGDTVMVNMERTTFSMVFDIKTGSSIVLTPEDSVHICMETIREAEVCKRCGVHGTDLVLSGNPDPDCPYPNRGGDKVACYKRDSKAGNWEAWIIDDRDCQPYRIVQMPDGRWWFAQSLNFHDQSGYPINGTPREKPVFKSGTNSTQDVSSNSILNTAWCPGGPTGAVSPSTTSTGNSAWGSGAKEDCVTYGALYPWATAMSRDGDATTDADLEYAVSAGQEGTRRGICPKGWYIPSRYDWGKMLNLVENYCTPPNSTPCPSDGSNDDDPTQNNKTSPCFHNYKDVTTNVWAASSCAFKDLLATDVAPARNGVNDALLNGFVTNYADTTRAEAFMPGSELSSPSTIRTYARTNDPRWNYYLPQTAGTDKYGFSIKPSAVRDAAGSNQVIHRGEFAGFWTSSHASATLDPTYTTTANAYLVGFRYNYHHNADFNYGVMSWAWDKKHGLSVRCIAQK